MGYGTEALRCLVRSRLFRVALFLLASSVAQADGQAVVRTDHATLRLVVTRPDASGTIRGALMIDLDPGWKTYWIDPGEAGLPPVLDFSESRGLRAAPVLRFPVPRRFDDGYSKTVGYEGPTAIAFTAEAASGDEAQVMRLHALLGVCEEICIPVSAKFEARPNEATAADGSAVDWAFRSLPTLASDDRPQISTAGSSVRVRAKLPGQARGAVPDVFLAGPSGWNLGAPALLHQDGAVSEFEVPVLAAPSAPTGEPLRFDAVLTAGEWASEFRGIVVDRPATKP